MHSFRVVRAPGDIVVVRERPTFDVGDTIVCHDLEHIVLEDKGDTVELGVPETRVQTRDPKSFVRVPAGNVIELSKGDLVLEMLQTN